VRTAFVRDHPVDVGLRQEIHEGLQVVEDWNSANKDLAVVNLVSRSWS
jgi:TnpA family transposase